MSYVPPENYGERVPLCPVLPLKTMLTWSKGAPLPYVAPEDVPLLPTREASHLLQLLLRATHQIHYILL